MFIHVTRCIRTNDTTYSSMRRHDASVRDTTHPYMTRPISTWHDALLNDTYEYYLFIRDMTHHFHSAHRSRSMRRLFIYILPDLFMDVTWLVHICIRDLTHPYVAWFLDMWHDSSFTNSTKKPSMRRMWWRIHVCATTLSRDTSHVWYDSALANSPTKPKHAGMWWRIHVRAMTQSYVTWLVHMWYDSSLTNSPTKPEHTAPL